MTFHHHLSIWEEIRLFQRTNAPRGKVKPVNRFPETFTDVIYRNFRKKPREYVEMPFEEKTRRRILRNGKQLRRSGVR